MSHGHPPETDVPPGEEPAATCPYCGRPFRAESVRDLHLGEAHAGTLTQAEREAHVAAVEAEDEEVFMYHLRIVATIAFIYSFFVIAYMVVLS